MKPKLRRVHGIGLLLVALCAYGQTGSSVLSVPIENLPTPILWQQYSFRLPAAGGVGRYTWRLFNGPLPQGLKLADDGEISGTPQETGQFEVELLVTDSDTPPKQLHKRFSLSLETPLTVEWGRKAIVNGQRIEGSVKVSNHTARDFDLTLIVLAVNDIGRATAIGYQHFPLQKNTRDLEISFGDTPSWGNYQVNVDVVGEEPISTRIFRARLATGKMSVTQGP